MGMREPDSERVFPIPHCDIMDKMIIPR
jgi:hypothetical protein